MMGTINCVYETPCSWCSKWDKKCDCKIGNTKSECEHQWEQTIYGGNEVNKYGARTYTIWKCKLCGAEKEVDY